MYNALTNWLGQINDIALGLGLLSQQQVREMHGVQAFFQTLQKRGIELTGDESYALSSPVKWSAVQKLAQKKGITLEEIQATNAEIAEAKRAADGVPKLMEVAEMMGFMPKQKSAPLLAAQAAAKMAAQMESLAAAQNMPSLEAVTKPRPWIDSGANKGEPEYMVAAQATQHLSEIFAAGLATKPHLANNPDVRKAMMAFQLYASQTLKRSGNELEALGLPAAGKQVKDSRDSLHFAWNKIKSWLSLGIFSEFANTSTLVNDMKAGFDKLGLALPKETQDMIASRLQQARAMEHKGIPMMFMQHEISQTSWAQRSTQARMGGGGGSPLR